MNATPAISEEIRKDLDETCSQNEHSGHAEARRHPEQDRVGCCHGCFHRIQVANEGKPRIRSPRFSNPDGYHRFPASDSDQSDWLRDPEEDQRSSILDAQRENQTSNGLSKYFAVQLSCSDRCAVPSANVGLPTQILRTHRSPRTQVRRDSSFMSLNTRILETTHL